jgi:hypothetical protein
MPSSRTMRRLIDLRSVGPATVKDLALLGITEVAELEPCDAGDLYDRLCAATGVRHDPCCEDVFAAAIAQARDPDLPREQADWPYWSRLRKRRGTV